MDIGVGILHSLSEDSKVKECITIYNSLYLLIQIRGCFTAEQQNCPFLGEK